MLAKKLLVRPGSRVAVVGAPPTIDLVLPPEAKPADRGPADIVLVYTKDKAGVRTALAKADLNSNINSHERNCRKQEYSGNSSSRSN